MSEENQKKKKQHDCEWKKWIDEVYRPWYEQQGNSSTQDGDDEDEGDEGGNPGGPPPPPPPGP